jgi:hypothetical protein
MRGSDLRHILEHKPASRAFPSHGRYGNTDPDPDHSILRVDYTVSPGSNDGPEAGNNVVICDHYFHGSMVSGNCNFREPRPPTLLLSGTYQASGLGTDPYYNLL